MPVHPGSCRRTAITASVSVQLPGATILMMLVAVLVLSGCHSGGSRAAVLEDSSSRVQLAAAESKDARIRGREAVQHADATRETADERELEVAGEVDSPERPSRWSKLFDRLRPARRIPLPLSADDPETSLHEQLTAF